MALSAFDDRSRPPTAPALAATLARALAPWNALQATAAGRAAGLVTEWGYAGRSFGWSLRLKQGPRVILYLTPCAGHFLVSTALGEKAIAAARRDGLPPAVEALIDAAPRYAEGRGVRFEVRRRADLALARRVLEIKLAG